MEKNIILAIRKASPSLLLAGSGLPGKDTWVANNKRNFNPGIYLWCGDCFDIFSGRRNKPTRAAWESGTDTLPDLLSHPWRLFRGFLYLYYITLLFIHRFEAIAAVLARAHRSACAWPSVWLFLRHHSGSHFAPYDDCDGDGLAA